MKQLEKKPEVEAISLDRIDTTAAWRAEIEEPIMEGAPDWLEDDTQDMETETWDDEWLDASEIVPPPEPPATQPLVVEPPATQPSIAQTPVSVSQPPLSQPQSQLEGARYMGSGNSSGGRGLDEGLVPHHSSSSSRVHQFPGTSRGRGSPRQPPRASGISSSRGRAITRAITFGRKRGRGNP